jgi:diguanylate cyclase (GGDEF)-like protein
MNTSYNPWLVILSIMVAVSASYVALDLASRVAASQGTRAARYWLAGGALSMGTGIWSMHFIGMLAMHLPIPMAYDVPRTLLSLLIAMVVSGFALKVVGSGTLGSGKLLLGGLLMGGGIAAMHYTGMGAMQVTPSIRYDAIKVGLSILIATAASVAALWIAVQLRAETILSAFWRKAGSALIMGIAIAGMHFTGMAAANFAPDSICSVNPQEINNVWLAGAIGAIALVLLGTTVLISVFDAHLANRSALHAIKLQQLNAALELRAADLSFSNSQLKQEMQARIRSEERIKHLAYHDALTTLPNRSLFSKLLNQAIHQAHRYRRPLAVMFLDLDRFKQINDTLGHSAGDQLLQEVASRLKACLRDSDTVARLGGDEFVVLLPELDEEKYVAMVAQKILVAIAKPFVLAGHEFRVTASIGISIYPQNGKDEQTLKKNADIAMYQAKQDGKNTFQFYSSKLDENSLERLALESGLRHALERNEFELHYQAKRDIATNRITGVEALLRWQHPDLGTVTPLQFIPIAEETGMIVPIGKWVIRTACMQNVAWQKLGLADLNMAVNLTARQLNDERLLVDLATILRETGMDAHFLELEFTESLLMQDVDKTMRILTGLKAMGVRIAIDDFGIGYSTLSNLQKYPLDTIKIDQSLIQDVGSVTEEKKLTDAIVELGRVLSLTIVAQGVETREQADYLRAHACDEFQGFYFNRPVAAEEFGDLLWAQASEWV